MPYEILATARTPALIIYLLDVSVSMIQPLGDKRRIDVVKNSLQVALRQMVFRSTKGARVSPRYQVAMYAYSDHVYDMLDGIKTVDQVARMGFPDLPVQRTTNSALAFSEVEKFLQRELPRLADCPAPLICHMTDGEFTGDDPEPVAKRILNMEVPDGKVLIENIYISDVITDEEVVDPREWQGILKKTKFKNEYAKKLRNMSSPLPASYRLMMLEAGYHMDENALMMLPGTSHSLVEMGFVMSAATPVSR